MRGAKNWVVSQAKDHHRAVNDAYTTFYGTNLPASKSDEYSPRAVWNSLKRHAKEHHQSVNAAYEAYYGVKTPRSSVSSASPRSSTESA